MRCGNRWYIKLTAWNPTLRRWTTYMDRVDLLGLMTQVSLLHELFYPLGLFCRTADGSGFLVLLELELELLAGGAL